MADPIPVLIPLINPNEVEAFLVSLVVSDGQYVNAGEVLATLETTKSASDLVAEDSGYVRGLRFHEGQSVRAGDILCYLTESQDTPLVQPSGPVISASLSTGVGTGGLPPGVRITKPALALAGQLGLDLNRLPVGPLVTETMLRKFLAELQPVRTPDLPPVNPRRIIVYGGGGHGRTVIDLLRVLDAYDLEGVIDDGLPVGSSVLDAPVLGGSEYLSVLRGRGTGLAVNAVGGIGNIAARVNVFNRLEQAGFSFPFLVHPTAYVEPSAWLYGGVQVFAHAYVGSAARVGYGTIVNTGAIVSHDCKIGAMVNISPGAILAGTVEVGDRALIGMGVTINLEVKVGSGARIGNGATVKADVPDGAVVRAGAVWPAMEK